MIHLPEFFRWQSENKSFYFSGASLAVYLIFAILTGISVLLLWTFKRPIYRWFNAKSTHLRIFSTRALKTTIGASIIVFMSLRSLLLIVSNYKNMYEALPFHLCRLLLIVTAFCLLFNKLNFIKYYGSVALIGALVAIVNPSFDFVEPIKPQKIGLDSIYFYDYIFIHCFLILIVAAIFVITPTQLKPIDFLITLILFIAIALLAFGINWLTYEYASSNSWKSNYLYLGKDDINSQANLFGPLSKWPWNLITWICVGLLAHGISMIIWMVQDKIVIDLINGKFSIKIRRSEHWHRFKAKSFVKV